MSIDDIETAADLAESVHSRCSGQYSQGSDAKESQQKTPAQTNLPAQLTIRILKFGSGHGRRYFRDFDVRLA
jgi:hypothetical protein